MRCCCTRVMRIFFGSPSDEQNKNKHADSLKHSSTPIVHDTAIHLFTNKPIETVPHQPLPTFHDFRENHASNFNDTSINPEMHINSKPPKESQKVKKYPIARTMVKVVNGASLTAAAVADLGAQFNNTVTKMTEEAVGSPFTPPPAAEKPSQPTKDANAQRKKRMAKQKKLQNAVPVKQESAQVAHDKPPEGALKPSTLASLEALSKLATELEEGKVPKHCQFNPDKDLYDSDEVEAEQTPASNLRQRRLAKMGGVQRPFQRADKPKIEEDRAPAAKPEPLGNPNDLRQKRMEKMGKLQKQFGTAIINDIKPTIPSIEAAPIIEVIVPKMAPGLKQRIDRLAKMQQVIKPLASKKAEDIPKVPIIVNNPVQIPAEQQKQKGIDFKRLEKEKLEQISKLQKVSKEDEKRRSFFNREKVRPSNNNGELRLDRAKKMDAIKARLKNASVQKGEGIIAG